MASPHKLITMSHLKTIAIIVAVVVIASSAVFLVSESNFGFHPHPSPKFPSPHAIFLPSSTLNSTYGIGFKAVNYTVNASDFFSYMDKYGLVNSYMWLYGSNGTSNISTIASLIMVFNSSSDVTNGFVLSNLTERIAPNSTVVSTGNFSGFLYSVIRLNASYGSTINMIIAHDGRFVLLMEFIGTWDHGMTVFHDQVGAMVSLPPSAPAAFRVS